MLGIMAAAVVAPAVAVAGHKGPPCYGIEVVWVNHSTETIQWATLYGPKVDGMSTLWPLAPGETRTMKLSFDAPPDGFPANWFDYGGEISVWQVGQVAERHVKNFARLRKVTVTWEKRADKPKIEVEE